MSKSIFAVKSEMLRRRISIPERHSVLGVGKPVSHYSSDDGDPTDHLFAVLAHNPKWRQSHSLNALVPFLSPRHVSSLLSRDGLDPRTALNFFDHLAARRNWTHDAPSHASLLDALVPAGLFVAAERVFLSMVAVSDCAGDARSAVEVLRRHSELNLRLAASSHNSLLSLLSRFSLSTEMKLVFNGILSPDLETFNAMIGKVSDAKPYLSRLFQAGFVPDTATYASLISGLWESKDFESAHQVFDQMLRHRLQSSDAYESLVTGLCHSDRVEEAFRIFSRMEMYGCSPTRKTCTVLIEALCDSGRTTEALALFQQISDPESETYSVLVESLCSETDFERDRRLADEAVELGLGLRVSSLNQIVEGYCRTGSAEKAHEFAKSKIARPDSRTFEALIRGFCREKRIGEATNLLHEMVENALAPSSLAYNALIRGHCREGNLVIARKLLGSMREKGLSPDESVAVALAKSGDLESAAEIFDSVFFSDPSQALFEALVDGNFSAGKSGEAFSLFGEMLQRGFSPSVSSFALLAKSSNRTFLDAMFEKYVKPCVDSYRFLVEDSLRRRDFEAAEEILASVISSGLRPDSSLYDSLVGALCEAGELDQAELTVEKMKKEGTLRNPSTYFSLLIGHASFGSIDRAFEALENTIQANLDPPRQAYLVLINRLKKTNLEIEFEDAIKLFEELEEREIKPPRASLYESLVTGLCEIKRLEVARRLYENMIAEKISPSGNTYNALYGSFCEWGFFDEAVDLVKNMIRESHVPSIDHSARLLRGLCEEEEKRERVVSVFRDLCEKCESFEEMAWKVLINGLLERGDVDLCFELLCEMEKKMKNGLEIDPETYSVLLRGIHKEYRIILFDLIS